MRRRRISTIGLWCCVSGCGPLVAEDEDGSSSGLGFCCAPLCDLAAPDACGPDRVCTSVLPEGEAPPDIWDVGYCALP